MNHSLNLLKNKNKGFATLIPIVLLSAFAFSLVFLIQYRILNFEHSVLRYEKFLDEKYKRKSDENLERLYSSFEK